MLYINKNGLVKDHAPTVSGPTSFDLGSFSPLEPVRSQLTWIQHLNNPRSLQLHGNWWSLTGETAYGGNKDNESPGGPTIDRAIAQALNAPVPYSSISLSTDVGTNVQARKTRAKGGFLDGGSADGRGAPFPAIHGPDVALSRLFGDASVTNPPDSSDNAFQAKARRRRQVVDLLLPDARRLRSRLAAEERQTMDQYVDSLEAIESRLRRLEEQEVPPPPATCDNVRAETLADLVPMAIACGLTRVVTLYVKEQNHNSWWHGTTPASWYYDQANNLLRIWQGLERHGVAHDSAVVWFAQSGGGHHRSSHELQALMIGSLGGVFGPGGRTLSFEAASKGGAGGQHVQTFFLALAQAMCPDVSSFAGYDQPLPGLLA